MIGGAQKKSRVSRKSQKAAQPKRLVRERSRSFRTSRVSRKSKSSPREKHSRATSGMSLTDLQFMAKSRGIPFGGLTKTKLVRKINNYF